MTNHRVTDAVAAEMRAALGRHQKTAGNLAECLGMTAHTAGRRLSGDVPFTLIELFQVGLWLDIDPVSFMPNETSPAEHAKATTSGSAA